VPDDPELRFGITDFTIDVWVKCTFVPEKRTLIEKRIGNAEYLIDIRLDGTIRGAIVDAANNNVVIYSTTNITDDRWHHIALVRDAGASDLLKLYIDGVFEISDSYPTILDVSSAGDITFGIDITNTRFYDGIIDDIHMYNRALTEAEILELYHEGGWGTNNAISVLTPNGGEVWGMGTDQFITWSSVDIIDIIIEFSSNNGASWELVDESVPSTGIYSWNVPAVHTIQGSIKISNVTDEYVFDISDNVFTIEPATGMKDENNKLIPDEYSLAQNHPNPFNPATKIKYGMPEAGLVTISVYDVLGNEVAILVNERMEAGRYEVTMNASSLSSGVYIYHMRVNDFIDTKKMILLR
jgi:hypothetical protein